MATSSEKEDSIYVKATEFQIHVSKKKINDKSNLVDFTEFKLRKLIDNTKQQKQAILLVALLDDYINGFVSIAWKCGNTPIYIKTYK